MIDVLDLEDALEQLRELAPRQERIIEMRFYAGLTVDEVAEVLDVSSRTVLYDWRMARAWLRAWVDENYSDDSVLEPNCSGYCVQTQPTTEYLPTTNSPREYGFKLTPLRKRNCRPHLFVCFSPPSV